MGKHFDGLVELLKDNLPSSTFVASFSPVFEPNKYLSSIVRDFTLFDFPILKKDLLPDSGKGDEEYDKYLKDYLRMSQEIAGRFIVGPFEKTVIEDAESAVFLHLLGNNRFRTTVSINMEHVTGEKNAKMLQVADVEAFKSIPGEYGGPDKETKGLYFKVHPIYCLREFSLGKRVVIPRTEQERMFIAEDITNATMAHMQQTVYIMDPENFIIRKENNASLQLSRKTEGKSRDKIKLRKTIMRPHYVCFGEEDTKTLLSGESNGQTVAYPVAGYWKTLRSEKFKNARGKILHIEQYYRGAGKVDGKNGWHYQVYVKDKGLELRSLD
jgi:hypothetical protein